MYQEFIDLSHLKPEGLNVERRIKLDSWKIKEDDWVSRTDLYFEAFIQGNVSKAFIKGSLEAGISAYCHRCLREAPVDLERNFHLVYVQRESLPPVNEEVELTDTDLEVSYLDSQFLPLHDMIREQIYLSVPMKILCNAACRGLCVTCGANLNETECGCNQEQIDPRWAPLKAIAQKK